MAGSLRTRGRGGGRHRLAAALAIALVACAIEALPVGTLPVGAPGGAPTALAADPLVYPPPAPPAVPAAALTAELKRLRELYRIPGIQAAVVYLDGRSWSANGGFADVRARVRPVRTTPFAVGSVTKTFVAALVLRLVGEGRLGLDDAAAAWLPEAGIDPAITVRQLLSHTSGLADFFANRAIDPALVRAKRAVWTPAKALSFAKDPLFLPGRGWAYSNTNYVLLGLLAERAGGAPLPTLLRDRFLDPLRLTSVVFQGVERPRRAVAHAYTYASDALAAKPVDQADGSGVVPFTSVTTAAGAAGALAGSAWDLARWARDLYGTGKVLSPELLAAMTDGTETTAWTSTPYGLGTRLDSFDGYASVGHNGRLIGTWAAMRWFPELGFAIAVTTNQWRWNPERVITALVPIAAQGAAPPITIAAGP